MGLGIPIIPRYITVHLGAPKTNARNVTLPFKDYIKNVASSEIYPTWPENALRANIYVITSFALNRIYSEYYRVQGYPFDITSSTSYDQAFVEGRDIFANISRLVDEQYNDYIVRRGQVQPMFSSYCNGTTATCKGLSQWGSYYLASQGYTPYRILQYYYGNDVDIIFNAPEGNALPSYPDRLLRRGDIGEEVRTVQKMLRRISRNYPAIPLIPETSGIFDGYTDAAVKAFQNTFGMIADGIVGQGTWNRIVSIFNAVKRMGELDSEGISVSEVETYYSSSLRLGDRGSDVRLVQSYLDFVSLFYPEISRMDVDGVFGPQTERAVQEFQRIYGLTVDGVAGRQTYNRLLAAYSELYSQLSPEAAQMIYPNYAFSPGDAGEKVHLIQTMLNALSQKVSGLPPVTVDGIYGANTYNAVRTFQRYAQQPISGEVGILTWNALVAAYRNYYQLPYPNAIDLYAAEEESDGAGGYMQETAA